MVTSDGRCAGTIPRRPAAGERAGGGRGAGGRPRWHPRPRPDTVGAHVGGLCGSSRTRAASGLLAAVLLVLPAHPASARGPGTGGGRVEGGVASRPVNLPRVPTELLDARRAAPRDEGAAAVRTAPSAPSAVPRQPVASFGFDAILNQPPFPIPADPTGALGDTWYLAAVNVHVAVYDRSGQPAPAFATPLRLLDLAPFPAGTVDFDPKVVYDHYTDHFVLAFLAVNDERERSWIVVATVPDATAADPSTWCVRRIPGDLVPGDGRQWADYPGLGFDDDRVTLTSNQFTFRPFRFRYAQVLSIPKDELYDCAREPGIAVFHGELTREPSGRKAFTIQPAVSYGRATRQFLVSFDAGAFEGNRLTVWRIGEGPRGPFLRRASLGVGRARVAPFGTQGGGSLVREDTLWDTGDLRLTSAVYDGDLGVVFAAHAVERDLAPGDGYVESAIRWYAVDPGRPLDRSAVLREGVLGTPGADVGWPALVTDGSGNLAVAFSQASALSGEFLSAYVAVIAPGETTARTLLLRAGEARYEAKPGVERWGDFNAASRDPLDPSLVALVNQFAPAEPGETVTDDWRQRIDLVAP